MVRGTLVLAGAGLAAGLWYAGRGQPAQAPTETDALASAQSLAAWLREKGAALHARATTLSELPRLAAAVATDADTVGDLTHDELGFAANAGETIELGQLTRGVATSLLRLPEGAPARADFARGGLILAVDGRDLVMTETISIVPRDRADDTTGAIAVSWRLPADAMSAALDAGSLVIGERTLAIGRGVPDGVRTAKVLLPGIPSAAALTVALGPDELPVNWTLRGAGVAFGFAFAITAMCLPRRRRRLSSGARSIAMPAVPVPPAPLARVGRYEPMELVRADDAAKVYVARATGEAGFERRVTLAVFEAEPARDERFLRAFVGDARRAARVAHPNLVEVLDVGKAGDACYVATEYVEGGSLERLLAHLRASGRRVPIGVAIAIARRMCDGLAAAHAATDEAGAPLGLLHGGLAASRVAVSRAGTVKVGDFGLVHTPSALALPAIAPELRDGEAPDVRVDVYGVGAILYELLAGELRAGELPALSASRGDIPAELEATVLRALARDRRARQRSCAELEAELAAIARGLGLELTDKQIGAWLATEVHGWSPTLRGVAPAALAPPEPPARPSRPLRTNGLAYAPTASDEVRPNGLRASPSAEPTVNARPPRPDPSVVIEELPIPQPGPPLSSERTSVAAVDDWSQPDEPRRSTPRFYAVSTTANTPVPAIARGSSPGRPSLPHAAQVVWVPVPETQTNVRVLDSDVDRGWIDDGD